jgi:hypothetical protein
MYKGEAQIISLKCSEVLNDHKILFHQWKIGKKFLKIIFSFDLKANDTFSAA